MANDTSDSTPSATSTRGSQGTEMPMVTSAAGPKAVDPKTTTHKTVDLPLSNISQSTLNEQSNRCYTPNILTESGFSSWVWELAPVMLHSIDSSGYLLAVSNHWLDVLGYTRDEVLGRKSIGFLSDDSAKFAQEVILPAFHRYGYCTNVPYSFIKKNGSVLEVLLSARAVLDQQGQYLYSVAVLTNVSEQVTIERQLEESELRYRRLVELTKVIPWEAEVDTWNYKYVGHQAVEILGYPLDEWYQCNFWENCIHPEDRSRVIASFAGYEKNMNDLEVEYRLKAANGTWRWFRDMVTIVRSAKGPAIFQGFLIDITASKQEEKAKIQLQNKLKQAQKMESLGTMASGVTHDFNNLLTSIIGWSELAQHQKEPATQQQYLHNIHNTALRAKDLVQQILSFSATGRSSLFPVNLSQLLKEVLETIKVSLSPDTQISLKIKRQATWVLGNSTQLHQVLMNLLTNARDAIKDSSKKFIGLELRQLSPHSAVELLITDSGQGISAENIKRIFEPYFTTKVKGEGTGLGLAVVHGIIKSHGGDIQVNSTEGTGTQVLVSLRPSAFTRSPPKVPTETTCQIDKPKVLLIDDEQEVLDVTAEMLKFIGCDVNKFTDPELAWQRLQETQHYDLIICDQSLPLIQGKLFTELAQSNFPKTTIINCSGLPQKIPPSSKNNQLFLQKPFTLAALEEIIRSTKRG